MQFYIYIQNFMEKLIFLRSHEHDKNKVKIQNTKNV